MNKFRCIMYNFLFLLILFACNDIEEPILGQWSLIHSEYQKSIYREIKFNKDFTIQELVKGADEFNGSFQIDSSSIIIGSIAFDYTFISNDTLQLSTPKKLYILRRVKTEELGSNNKSHFLRQFEYLGKNYQYLDSIRIEKWKEDMVNFFMLNADYPAELDNYPDINIKSNNHK